jgi:HAD superfamily hydrolase (TIGR01662 family)
VADKEIVIVMGSSGAGKTALVEKYVGHHRINRDVIGGSLDDVADELERQIKAGKPRFVLDNTYPTAAQRKRIIDIGKKAGIPVKCVHLNTSIEECQTNICLRMIKQYGRILPPEEISAGAKKDPGLVPTAVLFKYRKEFQKPIPDEGFDNIEAVKFTRRIDPSYTGAAAIFDLDGTIRTCVDPSQKYPVKKADVVLLPGRKEKLTALHDSGVRVLGISNQGDVGRGKVSLAAVQECFDHTVKLLGIPMEIAFCPHKVPPITCFCRKPLPGLGVQFIEKYKLDRNKTFYVGDMTTDKTFAGRCGIKYIDQAKYFQE